MKKTLKMAIVTLVGIGSLFASTASWATVSVRGYYRSNGTYVAPHIRSNPDGNPYNNFGGWSYLEKKTSPLDASPFEPVSFTIKSAIG